MRLGLRLLGITRRSWTLGAKSRFRALLEARMAIGEYAVEFDGVPMEEVALTASNRRDSGMAALRVQMRIISSNNYDALRLKRSVAQFVIGKVIPTSEIYIKFNQIKQDIWSCIALI